MADWLEATGGASWQDCWEVTGAETMDDWPDGMGLPRSGANNGRRGAVSTVLQVLLCHRLIRPGYPWLLRQRLMDLGVHLRTTTDREDFAELSQAATRCRADGRQIALATVIIVRMLVHTGKRMGQLTLSDLLAYAEASRPAHRPAVPGLHTAYRLLHAVGSIPDSPAAFASGLGIGRRGGQHTVEELVDRRNLACRPVRDLLVRYMTERSGSLDHASLRQLEMRLVRLFWCDLERHHPGICSLHLPPEVASAWRERARVLPGGRPRQGTDSLFAAVRAFYLDIAQWAAEDPATWGQWVAPSPVSDTDMRQFAKAQHHRQARMHARIRTLAPTLPVLVAATHRRLRWATQLLAVASQASAGEVVSVDGRRYRKLPAPRRHARLSGMLPTRVLPFDQHPLDAAPAAAAPTAAGPGSEGRVLNCAQEEEDAFWAWAVVEVLRLTGVRCEELLELTQTAIRPYRMRDGQVVVLLQVLPSKTDRERVIPVCPELAHALARIVERVRGDLPAVPLLQRWDPHERQPSPPMPFVFQQRRGAGRAVMGRGSIFGLLDRAAAHAGLRDVDGQPLQFRPHDFRRLFATEAVNGGLPVHIAAKVLGHLDLNTTQGYVAVYPEQVIRHVQAHVARRRALRPSEEYREPTDAEWAEFEQHFRRRKLALGDCYRPYGTDCAHEHACTRCPMLRMDPAQLPRLLAIEQDTHRLLAEARANGWDGEVLALETTLAAVAEKKAQVARLQATTNGRQTVWLPQPRQLVGD